MNRRNVSAWVPRYGTVRSLVIVGLLALVVSRADPALRETLAAAGVSAAVAGRAVAAGLWLLVGLTVVVEYRRQTSQFPSFLTPDVRTHFLRQRVPTQALFAAYVALLVAGGYVALFAREQFFAGLDGALLVVERLITTGGPGAFSFTSLAYGTLFVVGALAFAHAADRVVVASLRAAIARRE